MESAAILVQNDYPIDELQSKILENRESKDRKVEPIQKEEVSEKKREKPPKADSRVYTFRKGDKVFEVDEDAEIEFMADKKPTRLTLRDLKDRAAGDIAIKNRMHSLAEEKKRVTATFKEFARISKEDPLAALEYISDKVKEADTEFEYDNYLKMLGDQAEKLGQMDEKERKAFELEKKLAKANQDLSQKEREQNVVLRKQEILEVYPEIGDQRFDEMVDAVLENPELMAGCETEDDVMDAVETLIEETVAQRDIIKAIENVDSSYLHDNDLIFAISDQLKQNPDLEFEDLEDIVRDVLKDPRKEAAKENASKKLSEKQRSAMPRDQLRAQGSSDFHLLASALQKQKEENQQKHVKSNKLRR